MTAPAPASVTGVGAIAVADAGVSSTVDDDAGVWTVADAVAVTAISRMPLSLLLVSL